jgi:hypothetical protein
MDERPATRYTELRSEYRLRIKCRFRAAYCDGCSLVAAPVAQRAARIVSNAAQCRNKQKQSSRNGSPIPVVQPPSFGIAARRHSLAGGQHCKNLADTQRMNADTVNTPSPRKPLLRRLLSHHEIATLLLLLHAPAGALAAKPDVATLAEAGLVRIVDSSESGSHVELTAEGNAVLRTLTASR